MNVSEIRLHMNSLSRRYGVPASLGSSAIKIPPPKASPSNHQPDSPRLPAPQNVQLRRPFAEVMGKLPSNWPGYFCLVPRTDFLFTTLLYHLKTTRNRGLVISVLPSTFIFAT
jgi:hypothetical protein